MKQCIKMLLSNSVIIFFSIWIFFHEHSRITGLHGKREGICLTPHYQFHPLHRHLDISQVLIAQSSILHIASIWNRTGKLCTLSPLSYAPFYSINYYHHIEKYLAQVLILMNLQYSYIVVLYLPASQASKLEAHSLFLIYLDFFCRIQNIH